MTTTGKRAALPPVRSRLGAAWQWTLRLGLFVNLFGENLFYFFFVDIPVDDRVLVSLCVSLQHELFSSVLWLFSTNPQQLYWNSHLTLLVFSDFFLHSNSQCLPIQPSLQLKYIQKTRISSSFLSSSSTHFSHFSRQLFYCVFQVFGLECTGLETHCVNFQGAIGWVDLHLGWAKVTFKTVVYHPTMFSLLLPLISSTFLAASTSLVIENQ